MKNKNKLIGIIAIGAIIAIGFVAMSLTGCGNGTESCSHTSNNAQAANCLVPNVCTVCSAVIDAAKVAHTFGGWTTKNEATETTDGKKEQTCTPCGHKNDQTLYATGTEGLVYDFSYGIFGSGEYTVYRGTVTSGAVHIPAYRLVEGEYVAVIEVADGFLGESSEEITAVTFAENSQLKTIGTLAFAYSEITSITIPDSVTIIGGGAFSVCSSLTSITIGNSVIAIRDSAFYDCTSLTSITIPNSVESIGEGAFRGCTSLASIDIPDSVTHIGSNAFYGCTSLTSITIGNSVIQIGNYAFYGCTSLTSITIPDSVTEIRYVAFGNCTSLASVTFLGADTTILYDLVILSEYVPVFPGTATGGELRELYMAEGTGGIGTYVRAGTPPFADTVPWTKQ